MLGLAQRRERSRHEARVGRQGDHARPRHIGQEVRHPCVGQEQRGPGPQHLGLQVRRELKRHQLDERDAVGRAPDRDLVREEEELRRPPPAGVGIHLRDPGVDAAGIGLERRARLGILRLDRALGEPVEVVAAHELVDLQRPLAEHFRQPPLRRAPHRDHLPEPVLRMGEAQREIDILVGLAEDMGHVGIVAHDLDRAREALDAEALVIVGQRARQEIVADQRGHEREHHEAGEDAQEPAEDDDHGARP